MLPERLGRSKIPSRTEPATFLLVEQFLILLRHRMSPILLATMRMDQHSGNKIFNQQIFVYTLETF